MRVMVQAGSRMFRPSCKVSHSLSFIMSMFIPEVHKNTHEKHIVVYQIKGMTKT